MDHRGFWGAILTVVAIGACGGESTSGTPDASPRATDAAATDGGGDAVAPTDAAPPDAPTPADAAAETSTMNCAVVGCAPPPPCGQACTAPCGCCFGPCDDAGAHPTADGGATCAHASDCRVLSDFCGGCNCLALGTSDPNPTCPTPPVSCLRDPCDGLAAACDNGHCVAR
jgi:hypothetical protein